ncbi:MAG TPA: IS200/IS605 family transposase [Blastocatellia bacterium]|jgi:REP element-mobilizing transposase RayT
MAESFTSLIYHIVFSTKNRQPLITGANQSRLYEYIGGTIRALGGIPIAINGTEDHVHLLAKLRPDKALSDVLRDLKANASGWMRDVLPDSKDFSWQRGYGAFTVSQSNVEKVRDYVARQKEHHQKKSFRDEFIEFLEANGIEYDEKYGDDALSPASRASAMNSDRPWGSAALHPRRYSNARYRGLRYDICALCKN